jgi:ribonuclease E
MVAETKAVAITEEAEAPTASVAAAEQPEPAAVRPAQQPAPANEQPASTAGINAMGRAYNDPRVEPKPVGVVEIVTSHPVLFNDQVAPPVTPSGKVTNRAVNDPRGPLQQEEPLAEASGQS